MEAAFELQYEKETTVCRTLNSYLKKIDTSGGSIAMAEYSPLPEDEASPGIYRAEQETVWVHVQIIMMQYHHMLCSVL